MPVEPHDGIRLLERMLMGVGTCVVPLYRMDRDRGQQFVGSSVYCKQDNIELLFTARHVVEAVYPERFLYPYSEYETRVLPCDGFHIMRDKSDDFCIAQLTSNLPMWRPFPYANIGPFAAFPEYQHLLVGYPGSFTKGSTREVQKLKLQGYLTSPAPDSEYIRLNANRDKELIVLFQKENVYDETLMTTNFPNPNGMSGGAVLQFNENIPQEVILVGIMTRWDINRKNAIIATRFETITKEVTLKRIL
jgi:hypothetical protein